MMNLTTNFAKMPKHIRNTFAVLVIAILPALVGTGASAAPPKMQSYEKPLEGTTILRYRVGRSGEGRIVLTCFSNHCKRDRIRLSITDQTQIIVNDRPVSPARFQPEPRDNVAAFFLPNEKVLNRLLVRR